MNIVSSSIHRAMMVCRGDFIFIKNVRMFSVCVWARVFFFRLKLAVQHFDSRSIRLIVQYTSIIKCHKCRVKELVSILLAAIIISIHSHTHTHARHFLYALYASNIQDFFVKKSNDFQAATASATSHLRSHSFTRVVLIVLNIRWMFHWCVFFSSLRWTHLILISVFFSLSPSFDRFIAPTTSCFKCWM